MWCRKLPGLWHGVCLVPFQITDSQKLLFSAVCLAFPPVHASAQTNKEAAAVIMNTVLHMTQDSYSQRDALRVLTTTVTLMLTWGKVPRNQGWFMHKDKMIFWAYHSDYLKKKKSSSPPSSAYPEFGSRGNSQRSEVQTFLSPPTSSSSSRVTPRHSQASMET